MVSHDNGDVNSNVELKDSGIASIRERLNKIFSQKIDRNILRKTCQEWIVDPTNIALLIWIACVAISGAILFMVMTGMLNRALPKKPQRDVWFETNNQILNALFTLMCLYQHPKRIYHTVLLIRWRIKDVVILRKIYCKNSMHKPRERAHMTFVVILLHVNCFATYALSGLNLGYKRIDRPLFGVGICLSAAIISPAIAGAYIMLSPLGRDYHKTGTDEEEAQISVDRGSGSMKWSGGIFYFWDDVSVACLSLFCGFCVFGWNMERLGFGNKYVHITTFILFCMAPFWIFHLAAMNIENGMVREAFVVFGVLLCVFGLLYGGFWRVQMRKKFSLPEYGLCCNKPVVADFALWLFCWWCSLAQEVRTGNTYEIAKNIKNRKKEEVLTTIPPLDRENGEFGVRSSHPSPRVRASNEHEGKDDMMRPPSPLIIRREEI